MHGPIDHVGFVTPDLERAKAQLARVMQAEVTREFELPQFDLVGAFLTRDQAPDLEVYTYTDAGLLQELVGDELFQLQHIAYEVDDIEAVSAQMRAEGIRFSGPDFRGEASEAFVLGAGVKHLWSLPDSGDGLSLQLIER